MRAVPWVPGLSAVASGFATTAENNSDGTRTHVLELSDLTQQRSSRRLQRSQLVGHGGSLLFCKYYILIEKVSNTHLSQILHFHVAHPLPGGRLRVCMMLSPKPLSEIAWPRRSAALRR